MSGGAVEDHRAYLWARKSVDASPIRVLLFEDNPVTARVICEMLRSAGGCVVDHVGRLSQGLERLRAGSFDLVLLDLGLPDSEGEETLVRVYESTSELPIIVITAQKPGDLALRAAELGAQDFLLKSEVSSASLTRAIHYAVARSRAEIALRLAYDDLERRVEERTAELSAANASLTEEIGERQRAGRVLAKRNRELAALNTITAAINRSLDLEIVLETLKRLLVEEAEVEAGCIYLYQPEDDEFALRLGWGFDAGTLDKCSRLDADKLTLGGLNSESQSAENVPDSADAGPPPIADAGWNWLRVLLPFQAEVRGALDLYRRTPADFSPEEKRFFGILGQQIGVVVGNALLFNEVRSSRGQLQGLSRRLVEVQERERREIARELHDEVGQLLTGLKMNLELAQRSKPDLMTERIDESLAQVNRLLNAVRNLSLDLRPAMLDDFGLIPALLWLFERYESRTQVRVDFKHSGASGRYAPELETALYRIIQEALTNVARHAEVKNVDVRLWATRDTLGAKIEDEGAGFDPQEVLKRGESSGLAGMRERAAFLGGVLTIESVAGGGACISAEFPLTGWDARIRP